MAPNKNEYSLSSFFILHQGCKEKYKKSKLKMVKKWRKKFVEAKIYVTATSRKICFALVKVSLSFVSLKEKENDRCNKEKWSNI